MKNNIRINDKINKRWHYFDLCWVSLVAGIPAVIIIWIVIALIYG